MKKIILFLVIVGLGFFGWKMYTSRGSAASGTPDSTVKKVENTNSAPAEVVEPSTTAETSVQVLPSPKQ